MSNEMRATPSANDYIGYTVADMVTENANLYAALRASTELLKECLAGVDEYWEEQNEAVLSGVRQRLAANEAALKKARGKAMAGGSALKDCMKIPIGEATTEPTKDGYYELLADRYWQVVDECILLYRGFSPQCNSNESISKRLAGDVGEVRFIKRVWLPHRCDY